jgi:hypothetical protein
VDSVDSLPDVLSSEDAVKERRSVVYKFHIGDKDDVISACFAA